MSVSDKSKETQEALYTIKNDWTISQVTHLFSLPFFDLLYEAQTVQKQFHPNQQIQLSSLLSIKTGACPEDCAYCPQSGHYNTQLQKAKLLDKETIISAALAAKAQGATRFCMGAAWRSPPEKEIPFLCEMVSTVKELGLETCMTLGMLELNQAEALAKSGLDFYNHNLDTSPEYYKKIINTRTYEDRLKTLQNVHHAGIKTCCGGIIGMGETREDRIQFLHQLSTLPHHPESVPINRLVPIAGTPLSHVKQIDPFEFVRVIAVARILMPKSMLRLSAGRESMNDELQALCIFAGINSIFYGETLLTTPNATINKDLSLLHRLNLKPSIIESQKANKVG